MAAVEAGIVAAEAEIVAVVEIGIAAVVGTGTAAAVDKDLRVGIGGSRWG